MLLVSLMYLANGFSHTADSRARGCSATFFSCFDSIRGKRKGNHIVSTCALHTTASKQRFRSHGTSGIQPERVVGDRLVRENMTMIGLTRMGRLSGIVSNLCVYLEAVQYIGRRWEKISSPG